MFGWFKKKKEKKKEKVFFDLDENPIQLGDKVTSFRYELGECIVVEGEKGGIAYQSIEKGTTISWIKMIDASTEHQKVRKVME